MPDDEIPDNRVLIMRLDGTEADDRFSRLGSVDFGLFRYVVYRCHDCAAVVVLPRIHQQWHDEQAPVEPKEKRRRWWRR